MKANIVSLFLGLALIGWVKAQQLPQSNLYNLNKYIINPAYAGFQNCLEAYGSHLNQWGGIDGAPTTNYLSVHSGMGKNMGIGGGIIFDKAAFVSRFSGRLSYAYRLKLSEHNHNLRLGLSAGIYQIKVDASSAIVDDITDDVVVKGAQSGTTIDTEFGIFYNYQNFQLGVAVPQIFETRTQLDFQDLDGYQGKRHIVAYSGYNWIFNDKWSVEPSLLYRNASSGLDQFDLNALVTFNKLISLGAGYRTHVGPLARLGINLKDLFVIGYAYEFPVSNISSYSTGSHEFMVGITFCKDKPEEIKKPDIVEEVPVLEETPQVTETPTEAPEQTEPEVVEEPDPTPTKTPEPTPTETVEIEKPATQEIPPLDAKAFKVEINFPLNDTINYDFSKNKNLNRLAQELKNHADTKVKIIGHACDIGTDEANMIVSAARAEKVKKYLVSQGVPANQIITKAMGDKQPKVPNSSETNRATNRRVEFQIMK